MKSVTVSVYTSMLFLAATQNISQSAWSKQSWSVDSNWSDQRWIVLSTGTSCFEWCNRTMSQNTEVNQQQKKILLLEWPSQSLDLNPIEMLWHNLKRAVHTRHPNNITELKQFCKEAWSKIPPDRCAGLIHNWSKSSHTFPTLHCECFHGAFNKDKHNCLCLISFSRLWLSIVVT